MLSVARTVRIAVCGPTTAIALSSDRCISSGRDGVVRSSGNGLVSAVPSTGLSPIVEFEAECTGDPDESGYLVDIATIDRAARARLAPIIREALRSELAGATVDLAVFLRAAADALAPELPAHLSRLTYRPIAFRSATILRPIASPSAPEHTISNTMQTSEAFLLTETFEFAASHRLHLPSLSEEDNRRLFGKCNNPNGHGHNYRIEVAVEVSSASNASPTIGFDALERIVDAEIMARFDHRNLNLDCPEFAGLNPSVEHIARICHDILAPRFGEAGGRLRFVRVWETDKTSCRYPA